MGKRILMTFVILFASFALVTQSFAQSRISGRVTDESGEPLPGVNIMVKGTQSGTMTDSDGHFSLNEARAKDILIFSSLGFASQEIRIGDQKTINVKLSEDAMYLDDVVVIGYGTARKKDISGAISSVNFGNNKDLASLPNPNALSSLSSKVAGFNYSPTNSASGDNTSSMTIRGKNSIPLGGQVSASAQSVNQPLLIVDGVLSYMSINAINTSDIESIDVLKDASAAAIYGSRAANGVIIITTKKGSSAKPTVAFNASVSISDWSRMPKMVDDDEKFLKNRFYTRKATSDAYDSRKWSDYKDLDAAAKELLGTVEYEAFSDGTRTNWLNEISRKGVGQKYDVSVSGKEKNISYYLSGDYTRQQGIRKGDDYEKYNFLAKMDINLAKWLTVGAKATYLNSYSWGITARIQNATWLSPYSYTHCTIEGYENWPNSSPDGSTSINSPLWGSGENDSYLWTDRQSSSNSVNGIGYAQVDFPFLPGLQYKITLQGAKSTSGYDIFNNPELWVNTNNKAEMDDPSQYNPNVGGSSSASRGVSWNSDNILTYTHDFGRHHADVMVGYTREHSNSEYLGVSYKGYDSPTYLGRYSMGYADNENTRISRTRTVTSAIAYLARLNYNYANKYYLTGNFRRDGYSAFAAGHKWGNFYGASAAWVLSSEEFVKKLNAFDFLKFRVSWGQNGSRNVGAYSTLATVGALVNNGGTLTHTWLGNESAYGVAQTNLANKNLTWATVEKLNFGLDFSVLNSRLNGSIDAYWGNTTNMIVTRSAPYVTGFNSIYDNVGKVTNDGIEITLHSINMNGNGKETLRWETNMTFDTNKNRVKSLYGKDWQGNEADDIANASAYGFDSYYALQVGHPIGSAYDYKKLGIFNSKEEIKAYVDKDGNMIQPNAVPGDIKFEDWNGDGKISTDDRHFLGSPDPLFTVNLGNTIAWKNFSLYFSFRWAQGNKTHFLWFDPNAFGTSMGSGAQLDAVNPWTEENHSQKYTRYGYTNSENYLYWNPRSYLKLKELSLSYTIDPSITKLAGISNARVYVAATDPFTITNWSGLDPEDGGTIAAGLSSTRYGSTGTYKTVTFGINLTF